MWRYYLAATLIVVALGSAVFAQRWMQQSASRKNAQQSHGGRRAQGLSGGVPAGAPTFGGASGPWVMSALPDCFDQQRSTIGPADMLVRDLPPAAQRVAPGSVLHWNDCTVHVGERDLRIDRRSDRLRVPPDAALYAHGEELTLVWRNASGRTEIRVYKRSRMP